MKTKLAALAFVSVLAVAPAAFAESFDDLCMRVSEEWGTTGDIGAQCSCLSDKAAGDAAVGAELRSLAEEYSNDADAYEAASDATKAALDACAVNS